MSTDVANVLSSFWAWRLKSSPEFATAIGVHQHDAMLDEHSLESYQKRQDECKSFMKSLEDLERQPLSKADKLNVKLLKCEIQSYLDGCQCRSFLFPLNNMEGPQIDFPRTVSWMKFESLEDYEVKYFSRLKDFPKQIQEFISLLKEGIRVNLVLPEIAVNGVPDQLKHIIENAEKDSPLIKPLNNFPDSIPEEQRETLKSKGLSLIKEVASSYKKLQDFITTEYIPATRNTNAAVDLTDGENYYKQCLKFHITCDLSPQEVHDLGLREVKKIREEMEEVKKNVGFEGTFDEFLKFLKTDKKFFYKTEDELLAEYKAVGEKIDKKLPLFFKKLPKAKFEIVKTPAAQAPQAPAAYYLNPSDDGTRPGTFYINTYKPETRSKIEMVTLSLHEAMPGHHLQIAFAMEQAEQPAFRRYVEDRRYYETPARFSLHTAYMEGWGLYCEFLGKEMGLYEDPYDLFGHLSLSILRACRLVVDTGMHFLGWSRQKAIDFMVENTAMSLHNITTEVDRYITWPGQACAYKVGEIKIRELRDRAKAELGSKFDLRDFHDIFLSAGPMPLDTLEDIINEYIRTHQS